MDAFNSLPKEKQDRILNAAYTCFGRNGYKKTSVADIAGMAGVSKASIFHYFGTKHGLWLHLYNTGVAYIGAAISRDFAASNDIFERLWWAMEVKLRAGAAWPGMFAFFTRSVHEDDPCLVSQRNSAYLGYIERGFASLFEGVDLSRMRPGVTIPDIISIVTWVSEGFVGSLGEDGLDEDKIKRLGTRYIALLKPAFYREGFY